MISKLSTKSILALTLTVFLCLWAVPAMNPPAAHAAASGTIYYVDSALGSDANAGTSPGAAWKTLAKVDSVTFAPGDQVLFKAGDVWTGTLKPKGSGDSTHQNLIGKYGSGPDPILNGNGGTYAVYLYNVEYWTVQDLEITNDAATAAKRFGVYVEGDGAGRLHSIHLQNLDIHNIKGLSDRTTSPGMYDNAAIYVTVVSPDTRQNATNPAPGLSSYDDLLIQNNHIHDISTIGISLTGSWGQWGEAHKSNPTFASWYTHVVIQDNVIDKTGADGIIVGYSAAPVIQNNAVYDAGINGSNYQYIAGMWTWASADALFQYNEVARMHEQNPSTSDSMAYDVDVLTYGTPIFQYNYSHDNAGGAYMDTSDRGAKMVVRYNISQNDHHNSWSGSTVALNSHTDFYNNDFYNDKGGGFKVYLDKDGAKPSDVMFRNNIFDTNAPDNFGAAGIIYDYNDYYGSAPAASDLHPRSSDPKFAAPGTATDGRGTTDGYKLQPDSPLIGAGEVIFGNGGKDYWGDPLYNGEADIGAYEYTGKVPPRDTIPPTAPGNLQASDVTDSSLTLTWSSSTDNLGMAGYEVFNADTGKTVAETVYTDGANQVSIKDLSSGKAYRFYVKAFDSSGNLSEPSHTVSVTTQASGIVVDNDQAVVIGNPPYDSTMVGGWKVSSFGPKFYGDSYLVKKAGNGSAKIRWIPDLPQAGYYKVYYWLPNGASSRPSAAPFTVYYDGGQQTYAVNEQLPGGVWKLLGTHKFKAGKSGYVGLTDNVKSTYVQGDAVRFVPTAAPDTTPPVTSAVLSGWINHPVTISLNAADNASGVTSTVYSQDQGASWQAYTDPITFGQDGRYTLQYRSTDKAGNGEQPHAITFNLDASPPAIAIAAPQGGSYDDSADLTPSYSVTDTGSGVDAAKTTAALDGQAVQQGQDIPLYTLPLGGHTLTVTAEDLAGNIGRASVTFRTTASLSGLQALAAMFKSNGKIDNAGIEQSLQMELKHKALRVFILEVQAQSGKHIAADAAGILIRDAKALLP